MARAAATVCCSCLYHERRRRCLRRQAAPPPECRPLNSSIRFQRTKKGVTRTVRALLLLFETRSEARQCVYPQSPVRIGRRSTPKRSAKFGVKRRRKPQIASTPHRRCMVTETSTTKQICICDTSTRFSTSGPKCNLLLLCVVVVCCCVLLCVVCLFDCLFVVVVWLLCGCCVVVVWLLCGCCVVVVWLLCGCFCCGCCCCGCCCCCG